jgi:hypothetical protein
MTSCVEAIVRRGHALARFFPFILAERRWPDSGRSEQEDGHDHVATNRVAVPDL